MSQAIMFDTLQFMDELKESGMEQSHAEAVTKATAKAFIQVMENKDVATKMDLAKLENTIKSDFYAMEISLKKDLHSLEVSIKTDSHKVQHSLISMINSNMWKTIFILSGIQGLIVGLLGLMGHFS